MEIREAKRVVENLAQTSSDPKSLEEAVTQIIDAIQAQKTPEMQIVLWVYFKKIMDWLVSGIIGAIMGYCAPAILDESPKVAQKIVQETVRTAVGSSGLLSEYRYVSTSVLVVHQNPRAQSPEIARLSFGAAVKLIKKEGDFALIHWTDEENQLEIRGWVFARHLRKFS
ncbi:SH3 domain-containing protein [Herbaspirillum sp. B65]|uniref:SH3 domain-containing protein n=1 Tax=Herbaspirillum sp. B65 TaxID=137708 RepID=UPI0011D28E6B|nr:SH3 domain-containing protein [Herbaspirillum sp. B65]